MERQDVWREFQKLPPNRQEEVVDYIRFLASREPDTKSSCSRSRHKGKLSEDPCIGLWRDRSDMEDSSKWVRFIRAERTKETERTKRPRRRITSLAETP